MCRRFGTRTSIPTAALRGRVDESDARARRRRGAGVAATRRALKRCFRFARAIAARRARRFTSILYSGRCSRSRRFRRSSLTERERRRRSAATAREHGGASGALAQDGGRIARRGRGAARLQRCARRTTRLAPESFTRPGALARALRRRGVSRRSRSTPSGFFASSMQRRFRASGRSPPTRRSAPRSSIARSMARRCRARRSPFDALHRRRSARGRRRDGARVRCDRRAVVRSIEGVTAYEQHDFVAAREAFIASVASRTARAGRVGRSRHGVVGASATRRAASPLGSARFASSRSRPMSATGSSSCTRSRGRPPATFRRCPRGGCSISPRFSGSAPGAWPRTVPSRNRQLVSRARGDGSAWSRLCSRSAASR